MRGVVTDERSHRPLSGVKVARAGGRGTVTDTDGRFELRLPAGTHTLTLSRFGYVTAPKTFRVQADRLSDVRLELERTRWSTVSGRVTYEPTGASVPGATVTVLNVPDVLTGTTDANGRYTIKDVPAGDHQVAAHAAGVSRSDPVAVTVGRGRAGADVVLPRRPRTERLSLGPDGRQGNHDAWWPELSGDGNVVVFASFASNLTDDEDTNGELDIFATDRRTRETRRVSVPTGGGLADAFSLSPTVSRDGRFVGFNSGATNLVPGDTNELSDAFVHDRQTGTTELLSVASDGTPADGPSGPPRFSADGRFAVFDSDAADLVPGDTNGRTDVFLRDRQSGTTQRLSVTRDGTQVDGNSREPTISADGRYVAFQSSADALTPGDANGVVDSYVLDRQTGTLTRLAVPFPDEETTGPVISAGGNAVAFTNGAGLGELYVQVLGSGKSALVSATTGGQPARALSFAPTLTADGSRVAFYSDSPELVAGDTNGRDDVFVRDVAAGTTARLSTGPRGEEGDGRAALPSISEDGRYVAFESGSANLAEGDTNHRDDVFVHDLVAGPEALFTVSGLEISGSREVRVRALVKNVGERAGSYEAVLVVDGEEVRRRSVPLASGRSATVAFDVRRMAAGPHTVELGPLSGRFTVKR
ncbi:carboxypeptidase regulatory-like domain-containing protein [[Actinomadura] parvosata]|uniref:carboxypeptidase regulatory-like domain-containing protein n=1 Tax=[Actinomadura] parvosata TaxID=1955412 RepID=UPI00406D1225